MDNISYFIRQTSPEQLLTTAMLKQVSPTIRCWGVVCIDVVEAYLTIESLMCDTSVTL